jgi:hypothetical protein
MKTTNKSKTKSPNAPKPVSAPDPQTAVVVFKSGASLTLQFFSNGSPNIQAIDKFKAAYFAWVTNATNKDFGGCYEVSLWNDLENCTRVQSVVISWAEVQAINYSR